MADFVYELLRAGTTVYTADSGSEVARKFNDNFAKTKARFEELEQKIDGKGGGGDSGGVKKITIGSLEQPMTDGVVDIPIAGLRRLGVIMSSEDENKIRVAPDGTGEVVSLNVNKLVQDEGDYIIFDGNNS